MCVEAKQAQGRKAVPDLSKTELARFVAQERVQGRLSTKARYCILADAVLLIVITIFKETTRYDRTKMGIDGTDLEGARERDIELCMHLCTAA